MIIINYPTHNLTHKNQTPNSTSAIPHLPTGVTVVTTREEEIQQADIDELIHVKLEGELAELLIRTDPSYAQVSNTQKREKGDIYRA